MIKVGFIGAGHIAEKMANTINNLDNVCNYAVASRNLNRAREFAQNYGFVKFFDNYEEMLKNVEIDFVYIATIHSCHLEHLELCLKYKKNVLCEKILTTSYEKSKNIYKKFEDAGLILTEAMWTAFQPSREIINDLIENNSIGKVNHIDAGFEVGLLHKVRVTSRELGGGAAMDIGVYPISFIYRILGGEYERVDYDVKRSTDNVDLSETIHFEYPNGVTADCLVSAEKLGFCGVNIYGTEGKIEVDSVNNPGVIKVYKHDVLIDTIECLPKFGGFEYELMEMINCIKDKKIECESWTHKDSLFVSQIVEPIIN